MNTGRQFAGIFLGLAGLASLSAVIGCSSSMTNSAGAIAASTTAAPMLVTVSDAPLNNILMAKVTISAITLGTGSATGSVSVLSQPATVELSSLGGVQEPIELTNLALGTYTSATLTVSSAQVTYLNASGIATTGTATLTTPTVTVALTPALTVASATTEQHLQFGFDLTKSFDLTGNVLSFTPAISTVAAAVSSENGGDRNLEATGSVVSVTPTAITVQCGDSGRQFTYVINSSTALPTGVLLASIQTGMIVRIQGQTQPDGTILAVSITPESTTGMSGQNEDGAKGIIVSVTKSGGLVTGFTMVPREAFGMMTMSNLPMTGTINVALSSATVYGLPQAAQQVGLTSAMFTNAALFPGQSVAVAGVADSTGTVAAQQVTLGAVGLGGVLAGAPQGTAPMYTFGLTLTSIGALANPKSLPTLTLNVVTEANTEYNHGMTATGFAALAAGTPVEVNGYVLLDATGNYVLTAQQLGQVQAAEMPEGN